MSENLENLSPRLATRLRGLAAPPEVDIENMSEEEFEKHWAASGLHVSPNAQKQFDGVLEKALARQRLEQARTAMTAQKQEPAWLSAVKAGIAALSLDEVRRRLRESLSMPGIETAVYARNLEETTEENLRSLLLDLERTKHAETTDHSSPGDGV